MTDESRGEVRRPWSAASHPDNPRVRMYTLDDFFDCIKSSKRWSPKALELIVQGRLLGLLDEEVDISILVVPTTIRPVFSPISTNPVDGVYQLPEYEFEGWLLGANAEKVWVRGELLINSSNGVEPDECMLYRLRPGEELGTDRTPEDAKVYYPSE